MIGFGSCCLFAWSWTGHHEITIAAITVAINTLTRNGGLARLKMTAGKVKSKLFDLPVAVCVQDLTWANFVGKVFHKEVANGQIAHFMRDSWEEAIDAYRKSVAEIKNESLQSLRMYRRALTDSNNKFLAFLESLFVDPIQWDIAQRHLAKALHPLQDSYAQGHTSRNLDTETILNVYTWDHDNQTPHIDKKTGDFWPGHEYYDDQWSDNAKHPGSGHFTQAGREAVVASADLIACILGEAKGPLPENAFMGAISRCLDNHLRQNIPVPPAKKSLSEMSPSAAGRLLSVARR